jgi:peptidoglycan/xylan/chitin deacetylase (PgdA/CDA1 family)
MKDLLLYAFRSVGGFALARRLTRKRLRILCYHGFSIGDEYQIAPLMFMRAETFERRMQILKRRRIPVVPLEAAVRLFQSGQIARCETVITLDDGWSSSLSIALPILQKYDFPASLYLSTEHFSDRAEVFNVILSYVVHRSKSTALRLDDVHPSINGSYELGPHRQQTISALIAAAERGVSFSERFSLLAPIADALGIDLADVLKDKRFRLLDRSELQEAFRRGLDVQLHTHRHKLPDASFDSMAEAIEQNRATIRSIIGTEPRHFCYPSGKYSGDQPQWLTRLGIASATTCDPGLNGPNDSVMLLKRYLDGENSSDIAFDAEICGVRDLARSFRARFGRQRQH